jgi:hypothetical protein
MLILILKALLGEILLYLLNLILIFFDEHGSHCLEISVVSLLALVFKILDDLLVLVFHLLNDDLDLVLVGLFNPDLKSVKFLFDLCVLLLFKSLHIVLTFFTEELVRLNLLLDDCLFGFFELLLALGFVFNCDFIFLNLKLASHALFECFLFILALLVK